MTLLHDNRELLERFRDGDEAALRDVFRRYGPVVARSIRRGVHLMRGVEHFHFKGPSAELEVERLVEEVFSRAFSPAARAAYDGITPYEAYLCRIARNLMITEGQKAARSPQPTTTGELPELESLSDTPEMLVERKELEEQVRRFIATRPPDEQRVYEARFRDGDSQEAAAARLGTGRITVRRIEARLKAALLKFLKRGRDAEVNHDPS